MVCSIQTNKKEFFCLEKKNKQLCLTKKEKTLFNRIGLFFGIFNSQLETIAKHIFLENIRINENDKETVCKILMHKFEKRPTQAVQLALENLGITNFPSFKLAVITVPSAKNPNESLEVSVNVGLIEKADSRVIAVRTDYELYPANGFHMSQQTFYEAMLEYLNKSNKLEHYITSRLDIHVSEDLKKRANNNEVYRYLGGPLSLFAKKLNEKFPNEESFAFEGAIFMNPDWGRSIVELKKIAEFLNEFEKKKITIYFGSKLLAQKFIEKLKSNLHSQP